jgi:hypothetical protein
MLFYFCKITIFKSKYLALGLQQGRGIFWTHFIVLNSELKISNLKTYSNNLYQLKIFSV